MRAKRSVTHRGQPDPEACDGGLFCRFGSRVRSPHQAVTIPGLSHVRRTTTLSDMATPDKLDRFTETGANHGSLGIFPAKFLIRLMQANRRCLISSGRDRAGQAFTAETQSVKAQPSR